MAETPAARVLLFGSLSERFHARELQLPARGSVAELWRALGGDDMLRQRVRAARNQRLCDWDTAVHAGDEIAFMPPVCGGAE